MNTDIKNCGLRDTVIRVDLSAIAENMEHICQLVGKETAVAAVVKANGYGHGARAIAPTLIEHGAALLAVATLEEALELKQAFPGYPVLVMGLTPDRALSIRRRIRHYPDDRQPTSGLVCSIRRQADLRQPAKTHLKVDTGFHRIGFSDSEAGIREMLQIKELPYLVTDGIFSHLALLDDASNLEQYQRFTSVINVLQAEGFSFRFRHIADSIALVDYPEYRMDMVRAGALIYGLRGFHKGFVKVRQALTFETKICHISNVRKGEGVSYDYAWRAPEDTRVATLPFGYADGYPRNLRDRGFVTIRGVRCPIIGVICMDQCMADLSQVPDAQIGDTAIIYGNGSDNAPDIQEISQLAQTNKNEIVSRLSSRPARIYMNA